MFRRQNRSPLYALHWRSDLPPYRGTWRRRVDARQKHLHLMGFERAPTLAGWPAAVTTTRKPLLSNPVPLAVIDQGSY